MKNLIEAFECDEDVKTPRIFWFLGLSVVWGWWIIQKANDAYDKKAAEIAAQNAVFRWWNGDEPGHARLWIILGGFAALYLIFAIAHFIAILHSSIARSAAQKMEHLQSKRDQRAFEGKMQDMDRQNSEQAALSKAAQSKKEMIQRLGNIAQYIVVLEIEKDDSKRAVALQSAQSQMKELAANLASGQIISEALDAPEVRSHAIETSADLNRLGFAESRLNREIKRMFKLDSN
jgi:hypothetical protein